DAEHYEPEIIRTVNRKTVPERAGQKENQLPQPRKYKMIYFIGKTRKDSKCHEVVDDDHRKDKEREQRYKDEIHDQAADTYFIELLKYNCKCRNFGNGCYSHQLDQWCFVLPVRPAQYYEIGSNIGKLEPGMVHHPWVVHDLYDCSDRNHRQIGFGPEERSDDQDDGHQNCPKDTRAEEIQHEEQYQTDDHDYFYHIYRKPHTLESEEQYTADKSDMGA